MSVERESLCVSLFRHAPLIGLSGGRPRCRQNSPKKGTGQVLAQLATCHFAVPRSHGSSSDIESEYSGFKVFGRPLVLQAGNASCIYDATEGVCDGLLGNDSLADAVSGVDCAIVQEQPGACSSNKRKKAKSVQERCEKLLSVNGDCACHQCQRIVEDRERASIGDIHSLAFTGSIVSFQNQLQ